MEPGDAGTLYFEITGSAGGLFEGGLQYNSDVSIQPYMRTPAAGGNGYVTLNNSAVHYTADEIIGLFNGLTPDTCNGQPGGPGPTLGYMIAGQLDSSQNPESDWIDSTIVDLDSPAWLFFCSTPDMIGGGADAAGWVSPCLACSVSEVTSIAQGNGVKTYSLDGSYFGVDSLGDDEIQWLQVAFGNWDPSCEPGASECLFDVAANPFVYYGGPQYYPTEDISQENFAPTGYGPYESYSGIDLESSTNFNHILRKTAGKFQEPFPPLPCTADANGNCALLTQNVATGECNTGAKNLHGAPIYVTAYRTTFAIYHSGSPADFLESAVESETIPASAPCTASYSWSPGNPAVQYGDSNLP